MEDNGNSSKSDTLFFQIVLSFHAAAWQQMGKAANPITNKVEKDLERAAISIDMLDMLKSKTKGNLRKDEEEFLDRVLSELKLNYIAEIKKSENKLSFSDTEN